MNLSKYSGYFHDGELISFKHEKNKIEIAMSSADIIPEHMISNMPPLNKNRIVGNLYLYGIKTIKINDKPFVGVLNKLHDSGNVLDFEVFKHKVSLSIEWTDYPPKPRRTDFSTIEIEAEKSSGCQIQHSKHRDDPRSQRSHGHRPGITNSDGTPWFQLS